MTSNVRAKEFQTPEFEALDKEHDFDGMFETMQVLIDYVQRRELAAADERGIDLDERGVGGHGDIVRSRSDRFLDVVSVYVGKAGSPDREGLWDVVTLTALTASAYTRFLKGMGGDGEVGDLLTAAQEAPHLIHLFVQDGVETGETA